MTDQWPDGYFRHGTAMHLSHIFEDLEAWYSVNYRQRATFSIAPSIRPRRGTQTIPQGPRQSEPLARVRADFAKYNFVGHSSSMQPVSRLLHQGRAVSGHSSPDGLRNFAVGPQQPPNVAPGHHVPRDVLTESAQVFADDLRQHPGQRRGLPHHRPHAGREDENVFQGGRRHARGHLGMGGSRPLLQLGCRGIRGG